MQLRLPPQSTYPYYFSTSSISSENEKDVKEIRTTFAKKLCICTKSLIWRNISKFPSPFVRFPLKAKKSKGNNLIKDKNIQKYATNRSIWRVHFKIFLASEGAYPLSPQNPLNWPIHIYFSTSSISPENEKDVKEIRTTFAKKLRICSKSLIWRNISKFSSPSVLFPLKTKKSKGNGATN